MSGDGRRLPAVIWDMGGVIFRYFTEALLELAAERGWPVEEVPLGPTGWIPDPAYEAMMRGELDEPAYLDIVHERLGAVGVEVDVPSAIDWSRQARPLAWQLIDAVSRAGHPQALLTNDATVWLGERWWETWEPAGRFDAIVDVATIGVRKPAPEPYLAGADALGLAPDDCVFIDDMVVNCRGAEAVGMASVHVDIRAPEQGLRELAARLGLEVPRAAVLLDLDRTLVDVESEVDYCAALAELQRSGFADATDLGAATSWGDCTRRVVDLLLGLTEREAWERAEQIVRPLEIEGAQRAAAMPGLDELRAALAGRKVAIVTLLSAPATQVVLERHGLELDAVVARSFEIPGKPDPGQVLAALEALGVGAGDTVMIGDSERDEAAARAAGVPFIGLTNGRDDHRFAPSSRIATDLGAAAALISE